MPQCPNCGTSLRTVRQREGLFFYCDNCAGRSVTFPQIRRTAGDRFVTSLMRGMNRASQIGPRPCPFCTQPMRVFASNDPPLELDACKTCGAVWFDPQEFETVPESAPESENEVRWRTAEVIAKARLEQMKPVGVTDDEPDEAWKAIPAFLGFPVESGTDALTRKPWVTWSLAAVIAIISVAAFFHLEEAVATYGFIPAEAFRLGGLTWASSFFLHAGILHLVGNLYFMLIFGDNVEDYLGHWRYGLLILASTLTGDFVHLLAQMNSTTPCIGASGGISGVIMFYALKFPHARLNFLFRYFFYFRWVQVPAWTALVLWLLLQGLTFMLQMMGAGNVAATAHLGGAATGLVLWWFWRKK